jgi:hypothetical protein
VKPTIKCKNECPNEQLNFDGCCAACPDRDSCKDACGKAPTACGDSDMAEYEEPSAAVTFVQRHLAVLSDIAALVTAKKDVEAKEADLKAKLQAAMEAHRIKKFESKTLKITYVAAAAAESVDSAKLKKKFPDVAAQVMKTVNRKAYVKVALKGGREDE